MWHFQEWNLKNLTWQGNPFDLIATVTFEHQSSDANHTTEMFYQGNDIWGFRFTGTQEGKWKFSTVSNDPDLHGYHGSIVVRSNSKPKITGFLTSVDNKFATQTNDANTLEPNLFNVYMQKFGEFSTHWRQEQDTSKYLKEARANGFNIIFFAINNNWFKLGAKGWDEHSSTNPDIQTFKILENLIINTHQQGGRVHLWAWGDEARKWTPIGIGCDKNTRLLDSCENGINGEADRRLQRYIAARLGPLPGWTMSYGFDLQEWVSEEQTEQWADYLHEHMGWHHMLWARGRFNFKLDVSSYSGMGHTYDEAVNNLKSDPTRPHFFEERDLYLRESYHSMDWTRQHLWRYTMAGGHGGFWGVGWWEEAKSYPNPEQLQTHRQFWLDENRYFFAMEPANELIVDGNGYALKIPSKTKYIFYQENANSIRLNLSNMNGKQPVIVVNTKKEYEEINLGTLKPEQQTVQLPKTSDWAIAVGKFK